MNTSVDSLHAFSQRFGAVLDSLRLDPFQIREALLNILQNAYQALRDRHGEIVVQSEILPHDSAVISISDNGEGIENNELEDIFKPFFSGRAGGGSGLGLTICRELVDLHHGGITVQSEKNKGTQVRISLPLEGN
jgi:signal transduction histidine kinase